ncbi:MAG: NAD(+) diphosphatase [Acidimicrobiales bacterium]
MFEPHMRAAPAEDHPALFMIVRRGEILVAAGPEGFAIPSALVDLPPAGRHVLGSMADGTWVYGVDVAEHTDEPDDHLWVPLRQLYGKVDELLWTVAGRAEQIVSWDRTHRFCGRCGEQTVLQDNERARKCPSCGLLAYPRLSPATITLVTRGEGEDEEALLAWGRQFPGRFYSTLAGFVEPGENLEQCVAREIKEEVGVDISDITYFGSQPWPFPNSLMLGFTARYAGGELVLQEEEIVEAGWFRADALPPCPRGGMSIAGALIDSWLRRVGV